LKPWSHEKRAQTLFEAAGECLRPPNLVFPVQTLFDGKKQRKKAWGAINSEAKHTTEADEA
jgi:hypothetical protein